MERSIGLGIPHGYSDKPSLPAAHLNRFLRIDISPHLSHRIGEVLQVHLKHLVLRYRHDIDLHHRLGNAKSIIRTHRHGTLGHTQAKPPEDIIDSLPGHSLGELGWRLGHLPGRRIGLLRLGRILRRGS